MATRYIYNTSGNYVAFVKDSNLFDPNGKWIGFIEDSDDVYSAGDGAYLGTLSSDDRLITKSTSPRYRRPRPVRPTMPVRPTRPMRRLRMRPLPIGFQDYFEVDRPKPAASRLLDSLSTLVSSGNMQPETAAEILSKVGTRSFSEVLQPEATLGCQLKTPTGRFLGNVNRNRLDPESLANPYSPYGSKYSGDSILNKYSQYGSPYGTESPYNKFSTTPPVFVRNGESLGYLTVNQYLSPRLDPDEFIAWLGV